MNISRLIFWMAAAAFLGGCGAAQPPKVPVQQEMRWWKGNLHTHSRWSDGDDYPEMIVDWYKEHGYHFVALSDHNTLQEGDKWVSAAQGAHGTAPLEAYRQCFGTDWVETRQEAGETMVRLKRLDEYRPLFDEAGRFLLIKSEEITDRFEDKPVHVNATNVREVIRPQGGASVRDVMQRNVNAVLAQRAVTGVLMFPHMNHPNFGWAVTVEDLIALEGERFFEVYNGHPYVNNYGDTAHPSTEQMWDAALTARLTAGGEVLYGLAVDDAHNYHQHDTTQSNPGRGWVMVRAPALTAEALITAMERGDFYATTGVTLADIQVEDSNLRIDIQPEEGVNYQTHFIGTRRVDGQDSGQAAEKVGGVLAEVGGTTPSYRMSGDELYVRARIISSKPKANPYKPGEWEMAWTQPIGDF